MEGQWNANEREVAKIKALASSQSDSPVLMINIKKYNDGEYPNSGTFWDSMKILPKISDEVGAKVLLAITCAGLARLIAGR